MKKNTQENTDNVNMQKMTNTPDYTYIMTLFGQGQYGVLIEYVNQCLKHQAQNAQLWKVLGTVQKLVGQNEQAIASLKTAIQFNKNDVEPYLNLGITLTDLKHYKEAIEFINQGIALFPNNAHLYNQLATVYHTLKQYDKAVLNSEKALQLLPSDQTMLASMASHYSSAGLSHFAIPVYQQLLAVYPHLHYHWTNYLFCLCYQNQYLSLLKQEALHFVTMQKQYLKPPQIARDFYRDNDRQNLSKQPLKIGFISPDFRVHPVGYFALSVFEQLFAYAQNSGGLVQIYIYYNHHNQDDFTQQFKQYAHKWCNCKSLSDANLAQQIQADGINILVDMAGHSGDNRLATFLYKPAPVQVSWLGYFATTGLPEMDYVLADAFSVPLGHENQFIEKVYRLPHTRLCFTKPAENIEPNDLPADSNGFMTFGCFNNSLKMTDDVIDTWSQILKQVPNSILVLKSTQLDTDYFQHKIKTSFARCGIATSRLKILGSSSRAAYFACYHQIDIALDPFPYTGGTTSIEALWMGVPVLTLAGHYMVARQGVMLNANVQLQDWIADTTQDYINKAVFFASQTKQLRQLRKNLRQRVQQSPLFDAKLFTQHFMQAMQNIRLT